MSNQQHIHESLCLELLHAAISAKGSKAAVARELKVSRPYVSRVMNKDIAPVPLEFIGRVLAQYHTVTCPATSWTVTRQHCRDMALVAAPTHNPAAMRTWQQCQRCPHKPQPEVTQ